MVLGANPLAWAAIIVIGVTFFIVVTQRCALVRGYLGSGSWSC